MSTLKTIQYNTSLQSSFVHNTDEVEIITSATLKKLELLANEIYCATGRIQQASDRAFDGNTTNYLVGTATWDAVDGYDMSDTAKSYVSLNDDSGRDGVTPLTPTGHFAIGSTGTIRMKVKHDYSGSPAASNFYFSTGDTTTLSGAGSLLSLRHATGGNLELDFRDNTGGATILTFGAFSPVPGTEYDIEFSYDNAGGIARLFIDGVLLGAPTFTTKTLASRDYFYIGSPAAGASTSQIFVKDFQIFTTVQHTANFTSEVPRVVNIYPLESRIQPQEITTVEGYFSLDESKTIVGTSAINYVLRIDSDRYYNVADALVASDGSYLQSSTLAEWNTAGIVAAIDSNVSSGKNLYFEPVLYSGALGLYAPTLTSTTIEYNFFSADSDCDTCLLYGYIEEDLCENISSATVRVYKSSAFEAQGKIIALDTTVTARDSGYFEIDLIIPDNGENYKLEAVITDTDGKEWVYRKNILIPNQSTVSISDAIQ